MPKTPKKKSFMPGIMLNIVKTSRIEDKAVMVSPICFFIGLEIFSFLSISPFPFEKISQQFYRIKYIIVKCFFKIFGGIFMNYLHFIFIYNNKNKKDLCKMQKSNILATIRQCQCSGNQRVCEVLLFHHILCCRLKTYIQVHRKFLLL